MKFKKLVFVAAAFYLFCFAFSGAASAYNRKLLKRLFLRLETYSHQTGAVVFTVAGGKTLYSLREHKSFVPASVAKLLTSYTALKTLGADYTFLTEVYALGHLTGGVLEGNLYIKGYGDPFLVEERIWGLAQKLKSRGFKHVKGDLVIDGSYFSPITTKLKIDENENRPYNAILSALSVDFNTVTFVIFPPDKLFGKLRVSVCPSSSFVTVKNNLKTSRKISYPRVNISKSGGPKGKREIFVLSGYVPAKRRAFEVRSNVSYPLLFSGWSIKKKLETVGIRVDGGVKVGEVPKNAILVEEYRSPPLRKILYGLNRFSNNFMAEMLFRVLGAEVYGPPATLQKGRKVVEKTLESLGIPACEYSIYNGSGLSREMKVSPFVIKRILEEAYRDFSVNAEFLASMATPGAPGTLRCRFNGNCKKLPKLRAKTGSLNGVVTIAGYTSNSKGNIIGLAILCNGVKRSTEVKQLIDRIVCVLQE